MLCFCCAPARGFRAEAVNPCLCGAPQTLSAMRRMEADLSRRQMLGGAGAILAMFAGFGLAPRDGQAQAPRRPVLLTDLRLFDGETRMIREGLDILVEGDRIAALPPRGQGPAEAERIACGNRVAIPGLIDCHWHASLVGVSMTAALTADIGFLHLVAGQEAGACLMRGFTTVRDVGGPAFGLKLAIDRGVVPGPRIFPAGAMLSQTSGHGDFRLRSELPRMPGTPAGHPELQGLAAIADGADEVLRRAREQLMRGASQVKIHAGGGVSSFHDPLDTVQFTEAEMRAAVAAAEDWGTYVCAHAYTPRAIRRCIAAGVRSIEHGQLADEETARVIADTGTWWSIQPFLMDEDANPKTDPVQREKQREVGEGTIRAIDYGRRFGARMAFGTDILMNPGGSASQGRQLAKFARFMPPLDALHLATGAAGALLALSGPRAPYPGRLGVIAPGAMADLLVTDGEPSESLAWLDTPDTSLRLIMKDGRTVRSTL
jgi:imidazolonepropionase-like amidohydrolase